MTYRSPVSLVAVTSNDLRAVDAVFDDLTAYSMRVDGVPKREDGASGFATGLPPGCAPRDKHAFLAQCDGVAIGLLDLIHGYPAAGTAFIGLLAIRESAQGAGFGRRLCQAAEEVARNDLKARTLRLAVVETNPVLGFWTRMGFGPTGEIRPFRGERVTSRTILMEKQL
ncbi:GNAT family N-acetyltransferase [Methylobacterium sp. E-066]|uniref:GNAT family N-acetyltransferase n=1 Tax=Methylobacterium sp. E-066 TaxID=2836584 RepID=UPI001FB8D9B1|nr:GNAT family N-acetyltransferase [Methylobacterium sp. E-066]MCJ2141473.1 GNAT family N-acetyltransferase [Methylobacterium sp. E-066]